MRTDVVPFVINSEITFILYPATLELFWDLFHPLPLFSQFLNAVGFLFELLGNNSVLLTRLHTHTHNAG